MNKDILNILISVTLLFISITLIMISGNLYLIKKSIEQIANMTTDQAYYFMIDNK